MSTLLNTIERVLGIRKQEPAARAEVTPQQKEESSNRTSGYGKIVSRSVELENELRSLIANERSLDGLIKTHRELFLNGKNVDDFFEHLEQRLYDKGVVEQVLKFHESVKKLRSVNLLDNNDLCCIGFKDIYNITSTFTSGVTHKESVRLEVKGGNYVEITINPKEERGIKFFFRNDVDKYVNFERVVSGYIEHAIIELYTLARPKIRKRIGEKERTLTNYKQTPVGKPAHMSEKSLPFTIAYKAPTTPNPDVHSFSFDGGDWVNVKKDETCLFDDELKFLRVVKRSEEDKWADWSASIPADAMLHLYNHYFADELEKAAQPVTLNVEAKCAHTK